MNNSRMIGALFHMVLAIVCTVSGIARGNDRDLQFLLGDVTEIGVPGVPGPLCVFGDEAFPVVAGGDGGAIREPVVAATRMGKGRVVAFGHPGYFKPDILATSDTGRLMVNAVRWVAGRAKPRIAAHQQQGLLTFLRKNGLNAMALDDSRWWDELKPFNVLCVDPKHLSSDREIETVKEFVTRGGGLVAAQLGWGWLQTHRGKSLVSDHPGNRLLASAGIVWTDGTLKPAAGKGYAAKPAPSRLLHAGQALNALEAHERGNRASRPNDIAQAVRVLSRASRSLPPEDELLLPRLRRLQGNAPADVVPTPKKPLTMEKPLARLLFTLQIRELNSLRPEQVRAYPAAASFPGAVAKDAERVRRRIEIDTSIPDWHSTGLYAAPGELITVSVPPTAADKKLMVRIGAHSDKLWDRDSWRRCPEISREFPINEPLTRAANAFGGLIYIEVPGGCTLGTIVVTISGAVEAPYYVLGETDQAQWCARVRHRPAPWAELGASKVILTVPSEAARSLDDPEGVMRFWDRVLDACAQLDGRPLERRRPERYVTDVQISAGYMHAGYPIMTHLDMAEVMLDKARLMTKEQRGVWGLFHEMGHNHQSKDWTFDGASEVTVNLFTLYVFDTVCGFPPRTLRKFSERDRISTLKGYLDTGPDFEEWKQKPFLALLMYIQLQEAFGWDAFKRVFAEYRGLTPDERPKNDDEKRDQWMVRFSRAVGRNLGPFFQAWGVPTSEEARASISNLAVWMPRGFPPQ